MNPDPLEADVVLSVPVAVRIKGEDAIERITGPGGDEWRSQFYDLHTREDVLNHLAAVCCRTGIEDASRLDGWADLETGVVTMIVGSPIEPMDIYEDRP